MSELTMSLCPRCTRKNADSIEKNRVVARDLLRVARAADGYFEITTGHWSNFSKNMEEYENLRLAVAGRLSKALKEVEHLP